MARLIIHIGFPKTGTSYLQKQIFPLLHKENLINYISFQNIKNEIRLIQYQDGVHFDHIRIRQSIEKHFVEDKPNLISYEGLAGDLYYKSINAKLVADKLKLLFPRSEIVCVIRNQVDIIYSLYKQYIHQGGTKPIFELFDFKNANKLDSIDDHKVPLQSLNYNNLMEYYQDIFSREKVKILLYEKFKLNEIAFVKDFIDLDFDEEILKTKTNIKGDNVGYGRYQIVIARRLNPFFHSNFNRYGYILPKINIPKVGVINIFLFRKLMQSRLSLKVLGNKSIRDEYFDKIIFDFYIGYNEILKKQLSKDNWEVFSKYYLDFAKI